MEQQGTNHTHWSLSIPKLPVLNKTFYLSPRSYIMVVGLFSTRCTMYLYILFLEGCTEILVYNRYSLLVIFVPNVLTKLLCSCILLHATMLTIYKTLIQPILRYVSEKWTLKKAIEILDIFERNVFFSIISPVYERGRWRSRDNKEIYKDPTVRRLIKSAWLRWLAYMVQTSESQIHKNYC